MKIKRWIVFCGVFLACQLMYAHEKESSTCMKWKYVCQEKKHCANQTGLRNGCYRCVRPGQNSAHLSLREIDRATCNPHTAEYFRTMGYRCYHPEGNDMPCSRTVKSKYCVWKCVKKQ